jgi:hypothetical protein
MYNEKWKGCKMKDLYTDTLFICLMLNNQSLSWRSWTTDDGTKLEDKFIGGISLNTGRVSRELEGKLWPLLDKKYIRTLPKAFEADGKDNDIDKLIKWALNS